VVPLVVSYAVLLNRGTRIADHPSISDVFLGLNAVRILSIISLILVFASSIFVMVTDVEAVNDFQAAKQAGNVTSEMFINCDYIECV
jgi:hypothetical protein